MALRMAQDMSEPISQDSQRLPSDNRNYPVRDPFGLKIIDSEKFGDQLRKKLEEKNIRKEYPEKKRKTVFAEDIAERFSDLLAENVPQCGFEPPSSGRINILDIGCGFAVEADVVSSYFSGDDFNAKGVE